MFEPWSSGDSTKEVSPDCRLAPYTSQQFQQAHPTP
jgi:hypothetical protein